MTEGQRARLRGATTVRAVPRRAFARLVVLAAVLVTACSADLTGAPERERLLGPDGGADRDDGVPPTGGTVPPSPPARQRGMRTIAPTPPNHRPPQFVLVSFDGTGGERPFAFWRDVAARADAHLTLFLSGVYLLDHSTKTEYDPPRHRPGASDIGFVPTTKGSDPMQDIATLLGNLEGAYWDGHEIGTHFNGHFCGPSGVNLWTQQEWSTEIAEFDDFLTNYATINPLPAGHPTLSFGPDAIIGGRTPCLEGNKEALHAAEAEAGFRYDTSGTTRQFAWPAKNDVGLWDMSVASVPVAGTKQSTLLMDYNLYFFQSKGTPGAASRFPAWRQQARDTMQKALDDAYVGNRAPVVIGNHFNDWNGNIYTEALAELMEANCRRPEVICASHEEVVHWLDALDPSALATFQAGAFPKTDVRGAEIPATTTSTTAVTGTADVPTKGTTPGGPGTTTGPTTTTMVTTTRRR